jgi:Leucine-rich repeat (LRR) protein/GTPase SAR1 family protein
LAKEAVDGQVTISNLDAILDEENSVPLLAIDDVEILELSFNRLQSVPAEVSEFKNLKLLDLRGNPLESVLNVPGLVLDWDVFERLENQISVDNIAGISLTNVSGRLPSKLFAMRNLRFLYLSGGQQRLPDGIGALQNLKRLDIDFPRLPIFPKEILRLSNLRRLVLKAALSNVPEELARLAELRGLLLYDNPLDDIPTAIRHLRQLRYLNLSSTRLSGLPKWLPELENLEVLWLTNNRIQSLPETVAELSRLTALIVITNQIKELDPSFARLGSLRALCLGGNPIVQIPEPVFSLRSLEALDLSGSTEIPGTLRVIPERILDLERLHVLEVDKQPIEIPPPEVVATGLDGIRAYYRQLEGGKDYLCEAKLLIVGEPGAGKTSLAKKIENTTYELRNDEKSTEGIGVIRWSFPTRVRVEGHAETVARDFHVSIWDFGGQEVYHSTHQFFLTKRSLYVLVADTRKEDTDFHYWMNIVELLSDGSPLLVVKNEKQDRRRDINESRLRGRFANLRSVLATNLATNRGLDEIVRAIREELERLPHVGTPLPRTWRRVREALEQDGRDYVGVAEYLAICRRHGFTRDEDMFQLSGYLHDLGVCLHFQDDALLRKVVMLKPRWATDAVYRVLDSKLVIDRHGRFTRTDLSTIWSEPRYASMRDELVQLMIKFQLCYPLTKDTFLAPQLLESSPPAYPWDAQGNLMVRYEYEFMPKGILTRFIVATHFLIPRDEWLWRDGAVLERQGTRAEVTEDYPQRRITVRLSGPDRQQLLAIIDHELDRIHRGYPLLRMNRLIPCSCSRCAERQDSHFYPYEVLLRFARDGKPIQCPESYAMVEAQALIAAVFPRTSSKALADRDTFTGYGSPTSEPIALAKEPRKEVFVSYAWGGESDRVVDRLEQTFGERGVFIVRDKNDVHYRDSIQDFMRRIGRGKCIVVVLSKKYLESKSCMFELTQIADRGEMRKRVFPIVLQDADLWEPVKRVAYVKVWESRIKELNAALKEVNQEDLEGIREELDLYAQIRRTITRLMAILGDMNTLTAETHLDSRFDTLMSAIEVQLQL